MTARLLTELAGGGPVHGRHVVITAHADDEVITFAGALRRLASATIVQLTSGVPRKGADYADQVALRRTERAAAQVAGGWPWSTIDGNLAAREAHQDLPRLLTLVATAIEGADVVWTHPYEHGHLDHDSAAWLVQRACEASVAPPLRMEFASYHFTANRHVFGAFFPCRSAGHVTAHLSGVDLQRKRAAIAAYSSQAHIVRKFPDVTVEYYRAAPVYNFRKPAPPAGSRWDHRRLTPSTMEWRAIVAALDAAREAA